MITKDEANLFEEELALLNDELTALSARIHLVMKRQRLLQVKIKERML